MRKTLGLFAALAVTFLMSADLHSENEGTDNNRSLIEYCVYQLPGFCIPSYWGDACYLVDENCNWLDQDQPGQPIP